MNFNTDQARPEQAVVRLFFDGNQIQGPVHLSRRTPKIDIASFVWGAETLFVE